MLNKLSISSMKIASGCYCFSLKKAARAVARRYDDALRPYELNNGQYSMLTTLAGFEQISIQKLGNFLEMDRTTATAALKPLQRRGLVAIDQSEEDSRVRIVSITKAGKGLLARAMPAWSRVQKEISSVLLPEAGIELRQQLDLLS
jgi:DNA-binding MarR family transcriptional regulator